MFGFLLGALGCLGLAATFLSSKNSKTAEEILNVELNNDKKYTSSWNVNEKI